MRIEKETFLVGLPLIASLGVQATCGPIALSALILLLLFLTGHAAAHFFYFKSIQVKLEMPTKAQEYEELRLHFLLRNRSPLAFFNINFSTEFDGSRQDLGLAKIQDVSAQSQQRQVCAVELNQGMGEKVWEFYGLSARDSLGLFSFTKSRHVHTRVQVYPRLEAINALDKSFSVLSFTGSLVNRNRAGHSEVIREIRPWRWGEPRRRINWKLSAKKGELMLNTFEPSFTGRFLFVFTQELRAHSGTGEFSTFEMTKDLIFSQAHELLARGHEVGVWSEHVFIPERKGKDHGLVIQETLMNLHLAECWEDAKSVHPLRQGSVSEQLIVILPVSSHQMISWTLERLTQHLHPTKRPTVVFVDPFRALMKHYPEQKIILKDFHRNTKGWVKDESRKNRFYDALLFENGENRCHRLLA